MGQAFSRLDASIADKFIGNDDHQQYLNFHRSVYDVGGLIRDKIYAHPKVKVLLEDMLTNVNTLDIALFSTDGISGDIQSLPISSRATHVALFVREYENNEPTDRVYMVEATLHTASMKDMISGKKKDGPQLFDARIRIIDYFNHCGWMVWRRRFGCQHKLSAEWYQNISDKIMDILRNNHKYHFSTALMEMWNATDPNHLGTLDMFLPKSQEKKLRDKNGRFCSQFIAGILMECNIMSSANPANSYAPWMFDEDGFNLPLFPGYYYMTPEEIKVPIEETEENAPKIPNDTGLKFYVRASERSRHLSLQSSKK
jgi:hypothetical protein